MEQSPSMSKPKQAAGLFASLLIVFAIASLGGFFTGLSVESWYPALAKPSWTPSGTTIGTVWAILYTAMGIAAWLVWRSDGGKVRQRALAMYALQLFLNTGWSALFFGLRSPGLALIEIGFLWIAILITMAAFLQISKPAGMLIVPYLAWVGFAAVLNAVIWRLN